MKEYLENINSTRYENCLRAKTNIEIDFSEIFSAITKVSLRMFENTRYYILDRTYNQKAFK